MGQDNQAYCPKSNPGKIQTHVEILFSTWFRPHGQTRIAEDIDVIRCGLVRRPAQGRGWEDNGGEGRWRGGQETSSTSWRLIWNKIKTRLNLAGKRALSKATEMRNFLDQLFLQIREKKQQVEKEMKKRVGSLPEARHRVAMLMEANKG